MLATIAVFDDGSFVDTANNAEAESDNLQASLTAAGHTVTTFTGTSAAAFTTALSGVDILAIPELSEGDLEASLNSAAEMVISDFVSNGGGMIISATATPRDEALLNAVFGFSLVNAGAADGGTITGGASGTAFAGGPASLGVNSLVGAITTTSVTAAGGTSIYTDINDANDTVVARFGVGAGTLVYLGWDWFESDPPNAGLQDGNWQNVLSRAVTEVTPTFPDTYIVDTDTDVVDGDTSSRGALYSDPGNDGFISLREAITAANNDAGDDEIEFDPSLMGSTITLTMGQLSVTDDVTIVGLGADQLSIDGDTGAIFAIDSAAGETTIEALTLTNAVNTINLLGSGSNVLNLNRVVVRDNADPNASGSSVVVSFSELNITDSAFVNNDVDDTINLSSTDATIVNSTFSGNTNQAIGIFPGGNRTTTIDLTNVTIASNDVGIEVRSVPSTTDLTISYENSILADNASGNFSARNTPAGTLTIDSLGQNILDDTPSGDAAHAAGTGDQRDTDPMIGDLEENSGTFVRPLLVGSPAIDQIALGSAPTADQRGFARADGNANGVATADIGAYEFSPLIFDFGLFEGTVDSVTLLYDSGSDEVRIIDTDNPGDILAQVDKDDIDKVFVTGDSNDNVFTVDATYHALGLDVDYEGGGQANSPNGDILAVIGSGSQTAVYTPDATTFGDGTVVVTDGTATSTITFTGLEPVDIEGFASATLNLPNGNDDLDIDEGMTFVGMDPALVVSGSSGGVMIETVAFRNNDLVTIDTTATDGDDVIDVTGGDNDHGNDSLTIDTGVGLGLGADDVVTFSGDFETDAGGDVIVDSVTINVNADIDTTGAGAIDLEATRNIAVMNAALTTVDGDITLLANASGTETGTFDGIELNNGDITSTNGDILLTGTGGDSASHGVELRAGSMLSSTGTGTDAATITVIGTATGSGNSDGISMFSTLITSIDGDISLTGDSDDDDGVRIVSATVSSTGTGANAAEISINGIGNTANSFFGLEINGMNTLITSVDGNILLQGSSPAIRPATNILLGATVSSTGTGTDAATITIEGTSTGSGGFADGVEISGMEAGMPSTVTSIDGDIRVEGRSTNADGVQIIDGAVVESTGAGADAAMITIDGLTANGNQQGVQISGTDTTVSSDAGPILLTSPDDSGGGSDIEVTGGATVEATSSTITVQAGDDFFLGANSSLTAGGAITINSDFGNADANTGSIIEIVGSITADTLEAAGDSDDDILRFTNVTNGQISLSGSAANGHTNSAFTTSGLTPTTVGAHYDGGAGSDQIEMSLTDQLDVSYFADDDDTANSGVVNVSNEFTISFEGLAPLIFSGAGGTLTLDASALPALTTLTVEDDPLDTAGPGGNVVTGDGGFETTYFNGFTNLVVRSGDGAETITLVSVDPAANAGDIALETILLDGDNIGNTDMEIDTINIESIPAVNGEAVPQPMSVTATGGQGNDIINVGDATNGLDDVLGAVFVEGEEHDAMPDTAYDVTAKGLMTTFTFSDGDLLNVLDDASTAASTYAITDTTVDRTGAGTITYATIERLEVNASDATAADVDITTTNSLTVTTINGSNLADDIDISSTGDSVTIVNAGGGNDTIDVADTSNISLLLLRGDAGADTITVAGTGAGVSAGLDIEGGADNDTITIEDLDARLLNVNGDGGADTINVWDTAAGTFADLFGGAGNDTFNLGTPANLLNNLLGEICVFGEGNDPAPEMTESVTAKGSTFSESVPVGDTLNLNDQGYGMPANYNLGDGTFDRDAAVANVTFATVETINLNAGSGANDIDVDDTTDATKTTVTSQDAADDIDITTTGTDSILVVNAAGGADDIDIASTGDSSITIVNGGDDVDTIDMAGSGVNAGVELNGDAGDDNLTVANAGAGTVTDINGGAGTDTITIEDITSGLIQADGDGDADTITLEALPSTASAQLNGGAGNDMINLGDGTPEISNILGMVMVDGGDNDPLPEGFAAVTAKGIEIRLDLPEGDMLNINDNGYAMAAQYNLSDTMFDRDGTVAPTMYTAIETINLDTGSGANDVNITDTPDSTRTNLTTQDAADDIDVTTTGVTSILIISTNAGTDSVDIASTGPASVTSVFTGDDSDTITLATSGGGSGVAMNGQGDDDTITITSTGVGSVTFAAGSAGEDTINVAGTGAGSVTDVLGGLNTDEINIGPNLDNINGNICVYGNAHDVEPTNDLTITGDTNSLEGGDVLNVSDAANGAPRTYTITDTTVDSSGATGQIIYDTVEELNFTSTAGAAEVDVTTTLGGIQTTVTTQGAADEIDVATTGADSNVIINAGGGNDDINVVTTGSEAFLLANGNADDDTLTLQSTGDTSSRVELNGDTPALNQFGSPLNLSDDSTSNTTFAALDFSFPYAGTTYMGADIFSVSSNGFVSLGGDNGSGCCSGDPSQLVNDPFARLAPFWADIHPGSFGDAYIQAFNDDADSENDRVVVTWDSVLFDSDNPVNFQVTLIEDGTIIFGYEGLDTRSPFDDDTLIGISPGGGVADPGSTDLTASSPFNSGAEPTIYELFVGSPPAIDIDFSSITFAPNGDGFDVTVAPLTPAEGMDTINVWATEATSGVQLNGGPLNDTINLGSPAMTTDGISPDTVTIDGGTNTAGDTRTVEAGANVINSLSMLDDPAPYDSQSILDVDGGGLPNGTSVSNLETGDTVWVRDSGEADNNTYENSANDTLARNGDNLFMIVGDSVETVEIQAGGGDDLFIHNLPFDPDVVSFNGGAGMNPVVVLGTAGDDVISVGPAGGSGGARNPIEISNASCLQIEGMAGNDEIVNNSNVSTIISGGAGDDILVGGSNDDVILGGAGVDALFGQAGNDFLFSDENIQGDQFADDGELLDGGLGLGDAADQQGVDFIRNVEILEDGGANKSVLFWLRGVIADVDLDDAFETIGCFPFLQPNDITNSNLGNVTMTMVNNVNVMGEASFTFNPDFQPGFLTIEGDYDEGATDPNALLRFYLVDDRGIGFGASANDDGADRIDAELFDPSREYTVIVFGSNPDVDLTFTNALTQNSPLTIHGTEGDDVVSITTGDSSIQIVYNGVPYEFDNASTESVTFLGNGGHDTFTVDGISSTQFTVHGPGSTTLTGSPTAIHTAGVEEIDYLLNGALRSYLSSEVETFDWQNAQNPADVDASGVVTLNDALLIVSEIRRGGVRNIAPHDPGATPTYFDTNGDGMLTLADAMLVIAEMRSLAEAGAGEGGSSEGESDSDTSAGSSLVSEGEASGADAYAALLAEQSTDDDDDATLDASIDSIADDIAASLDS